MRVGKLIKKRHLGDVVCPGDAVQIFAQCCRVTGNVHDIVVALGNCGRMWVHASPRWINKDAGEIV